MKYQEIKTENTVNVITHETDYLNYVTKSSTKEQRGKFDIGDIFINAAVCKKCGDYIRSINRHDYKECGCGNIAVDGGSWYNKRVGTLKDYIDVVEYFYDAKTKIKQNGNTKKKKKK